MPLFHSQSVRHSCASRAARNPNRRNSSSNSWPHVRQRTRRKGKGAPSLPPPSARWLPGFWPRSANVYLRLTASARGGQIRPPRCTGCEFTEVANIGLQLYKRCTSIDRYQASGFSLTFWKPHGPPFFQDYASLRRCGSPQPPGGRGRSPEASQHRRLRQG